MRRIYVSRRIKGRNISIISNNCMGAEICHSLGMRFNSPTVNLQIMPEDYIRFCSNLVHYLKEDVQECNEFTRHQRQMIRKEFGREVEELSFPFGMCGDILIAFQHYQSFDKAKEDWNRRCSRVDLSHCGIILTVDSKYEEEAMAFDQLGYANKILLAVNWSPQLPNTRTESLDKPAGIHYFEYCSAFKKYYEKNFNIAEWVVGLSRT
ncbi:MAG: DUF1919 domain-containing protein [Lachnospiraceae bacterium]|nr:DUF1919 domain-containing protein [Lachnospiraceae bacterium]